MESSAGWSLHLTVLGALAAVGVALTIYDYTAASSSGGPISLRGIVSWLYWVGFAAFAAASTATFALLRARLGAPLSYAAAVPLAGAFAAAIWFGWRAIEQPLARNANDRLARDLASRLTFESWSMSEGADGVVRFTATVRAERNIAIEFEPTAGIGGYEATELLRPEGAGERRLKAGERAVFEGSVKRKQQGAFDEIDLFFKTWLTTPNPAAKGGVALGDSGQIAFSSSVTQDTVVFGFLKRPLPARTEAGK